MKDGLLLPGHLIIRTPYLDMPAVSTRMIWSSAFVHAKPLATPPFYQKNVLNKKS